MLSLSQGKVTTDGKFECNVKYDSYTKNTETQTAMHRKRISSLSLSLSPPPPPPPPPNTSCKKITLSLLKYDSYNYYNCSDTNSNTQEEKNSVCLSVCLPPSSSSLTPLPRSVGTISCGRTRTFVVACTCCAC